MTSLLKDVFYKNLLRDRYRAQLKKLSDTVMEKHLKYAKSPDKVFSALQSLVEGASYLLRALLLGSTWMHKLRSEQMHNDKATLYDRVCSRHKTKLIVDKMCNQCRDFLREIDCLK